MATARPTASTAAAPPLLTHALPTLERGRVEAPAAFGDHTWSTTDGLILHGLRTDDHCWLWSPGVATFRFAASGPVTYDGDGDLARLLWQRSALPLALEARGLAVLHASAVNGERGCVAICGRSGAGKSTVAAAAVAAGGHAVADDALAFSWRGGAPVALTLPFELRPRPGTISLGSARGGGGLELPLRHVVLLDPAAEAGGPTTEPVAPAAALGALMPHAYCFSLADSRERLLRDYTRLVEAVPVHRLSFLRDPSELPTMVETIRGLVDS